PAHERDRRDDAARRKGGLGAEPILYGHHRGVLPAPLQPRGGCLELSRLRRDADELGHRQLGGVGGRGEHGPELGTPWHAQALLVQRARVFLSPTDNRDLADSREVRREQAADHAGADYAEMLDSVLRNAWIARVASL